MTTFGVERDLETIVGRRRAIWRGALAALAAIAVLAVVAAAGAGPLGFVALALAVPVAFVPKVERDLGRIVTAARSGRSLRASVSVRTGTPGGGSAFRQVYLQVWEGGRVAIEVPVGAVLSGIPAKQRALAIAGKAEATLYGDVRPGAWVVPVVDDGMIPPSGPALGVT